LEEETYYVTTIGYFNRLNDLMKMRLQKDNKDHIEISLNNKHRNTSSKKQRDVVNTTLNIPNLNDINERIEILNFHHKDML